MAAPLLPPVAKTVKRMKTKVCLVGEAAVGKTSLIRRYVLDEFDDRYITTLGAKVSKKEMDLDLPARDERLHLDMTIWDIMGEKGFRELLKEAFFFGAKGVLAVVDVTRYKTLQELDDWIQSVFNVVGPVPVVYAVNKVDLRGQPGTYGDKEIEVHAKAFGAPFLYTSAKTGENVEKAFGLIAQAILTRNVED